jgi:hypothetical protein
MKSVHTEISNIPRDDGLPYSQVGPWAIDKYSLVSLYDSLFSTGMKNRWNSRIYIDLFACDVNSLTRRGTKSRAGQPRIPASAKLVRVRPESERRPQVTMARCGAIRGKSGVSFNFLLKRYQK